MDWEFPKTYNAARKGQWDLADALLEEVRGREIEAKCAACSTELAERGIEYTPHYLASLRHAAKTFPKGDRPAWLTTEMAREARDKTVLRKAVQMAEEEGVPLTKRFISRTRQAMTAHVAKTTGVKVRPRTSTGSAPRKPTKDDVARRKVEVAHAKEAAPTSQLRNQANITRLDLLVTEAKINARKFLEGFSGTETTAVERREWVEDIDLMIEAWDMVKKVLTGARVADEAEDWLRSLA